MREEGKGREESEERDRRVKRFKIDKATTKNEGRVMTWHFKEARIFLDTSAFRDLYSKNEFGNILD